MPITTQQNSALNEVIHAILTATPPKGRRQLAGMFLVLVDRSDWPHYYEVIPEPRCLDNIKASVAKGRYKETTDVYTDLSLVFWNAIFYNEPGSQIANDAETLKSLLESEWNKRPVLGPARTSPPPSAPQMVHKVVEQETKPKPPPAVPVKQASSTPAVQPPAVAAPTVSFQSRTITPAVAPAVASTSNLDIRPSTPDIDVDGMSPDSENDGPIMERDHLSEEIAKQLERGLPRWAGFSDQGWMEYATPERMSDILHAIKTHKDIIGNRISSAFDTVPEDSIANLSSSVPVSLRLIETRLRSNEYTTAAEFDLDMARLFEKGRRWHEPTTEAYGRVLLLQRLYQALTSPNPPIGPPYASETNFAALAAGPGSVKPVHGADTEGVPNVTTHRVLSKDRQFVDELHYKGWAIKLADWLHLSNPDDPSRPVIGQVFRCWVSDEPAKKGQAGVTVSWYYRPEQTFHPANRSFWEGEVFKTSHFADHPIEDLIEKIACQFTARHVRGRPRPPFWYVGWPLYVCDSRYNDRERIFVKIKNWNSCVPEEVRKSVEFMPIYPFERMVYPARRSSPFISSRPQNAKWPGGLLPSTAEGGADGDGAGKRSRKEGGGNGINAPRAGYGGAVGSAQHQVYSQAPQTGYYPSAGYAPPAPVQYQPLAPVRPQGPDRSVVNAAGGLAAIQVDKLPPETAKHFDRDPETNQVLWFASAPVDTARPRLPKHSLEYLNFVAKKRKRETEAGARTSGEGENGVMDVDVDAPAEKRCGVPPPLSEMLRAIPMDGLLSGSS
ncbi:bromeodomain-containing protein [Ephemerocybe angulata]|uniref:Bromeodomain-containing protein n=1 Tax=Ephemerocybe angulata TaxID=980116 RepID=A0A8H6MCB2_9AGAR|nr:bromeodomain-containing protein [Tulosesus angulatus]